MVLVRFLTRVLCRWPARGRRHHGASRTLVARGRGKQRASHPGVARPAAPLGRARRRWADGAGAVDGRGRGPRRDRVSLHDPRLHLPVHRASRLRRGGSDGQPASSRSGYLVRRGRAGGRRFDLRAAGEPLRARGAGARRAGGDVRGQPARWADAPAGADREVAGLGGLHRLGRLGRAGGADRADRLGARLGHRPVAAGIGVAASPARRVRRGGRDLGDVQRADRRGVLRAGADPAQLRDALLRPGRAQLGHGGCDRPRGVRQPPVPVAARASRSARRSSCCSTPASGCSPPASGSASCACSTPGRTSADRIWNGRPDWLRPAAGGVLLGLLLLAVPEMYGVGYPVLAARGRRPLRDRSRCSGCSRRRSSRRA